MSSPIISPDVKIDNQLQSPLLRLPGELRNKIYGYVLDNLGGKDNLHATEHHYAFMIPRDPNPGQQLAPLKRLKRTLQGQRSKASSQLPSTLHYLKDGTDRWDQRGSYHELNNLKFVYRKMYLETRKLGRAPFRTTLTFPCFNDEELTFPYFPTFNDEVSKKRTIERMRQNPTLQAFARFVRECNAERLAALRVVHVEMIWPREWNPHPDRRAHYALWAEWKLALDEVVYPLFIELLPFLTRGAKAGYEWNPTYHYCDGFTLIQHRSDRKKDAIFRKRMRPLVVSPGVFAPRNFVNLGNPTRVNPCGRYRILARNLPRREETG